MGRRLALVFLASCFTCFVLLFHAPQNVASSRLTTLFNDSVDPEFNGTPPRILLVSALFQISHSKHSEVEYATWLEHFLGKISTDVYFFTSPNLTSLVRSARSKSSSSPSPFPLHLNATFHSPFSVPPLRHLSSTYARQHRIDPERFRHSPELYAIWNAKPYFVTEAIANLEREGKTYDYVFWNDAGSFRYEHWYTSWPDPGRVSRVWDAAERSSGGGTTSKKEDWVFFPISGVPRFQYRWWKEYHGPLAMDFSEGSFFGGSPSAMRWFSRAFYLYHDFYLSRSFFVGKDQSIFNSLFLLFPDRFITMHYGDVPSMDIELSGVCCWQWWYYHFWLGDERGGRKVRAVWKAKLEEWGKFSGKHPSWSMLSTAARAWVRWAWKGKPQVPSTTELPPVETMRNLLRRRFGWGWSPPPARHAIESDL